MVSAAHSPEGCGRKKSSHLHAEALRGLAETQDAPDLASPICHYVLPSFSSEASLRCAGIQRRGRGGRGLYYSSCNCKKLRVVLGKLLPTALDVIEIRRGTGMWPNTISSPVLRKESPIIYFKGAVTRVNKIFHIDVFIGGERGFPQECNKNLDKLNNNLTAVHFIMHFTDSSKLCPSSLFPSLHCCAVEVSEQ